MTSVLLIDYGVGNLLSVRRALEVCGVDVVVSGDPELVVESEHVVLPGVGAFGDCIGALGAQGLVEPVLQHVAAGRPLLGICVGMQMLFDVSEEFGEHKGLGILPGRVRRIPEVDAAGSPHKVPHIGWNGLVPPQGADWTDTLLEDLSPGDTCYFVHAYSAVPDDDSDRLADADYNGVRVCAAVRRGRTFGCQFHPEKSGVNGLKILRAFVETSS